jgi:putative nucleotidyltransferase with HDIG domain
MPERMTPAAKKKSGIVPEIFAFIEAIPQSVLVLDSRRKTILAANQAVLALTGLSLSEIQNTPFAHFQQQALPEAPALDPPRKTENISSRWQCGDRALDLDIAFSPWRWQKQSLWVAFIREARPQPQTGSNRLQAISEAAREMTAILDLDELKKEIIHAVRRITGCYCANLFLEKNGKFVFAFGEGGYVHGQLPIGYVLEKGQGVVGMVGQRNQALIVPDVTKEPGYVYWEGMPHTKSEMAVPINSKGKVIGILDLESNRLDAFDATDVETLSLLGSQLSVALENARLFEQTELRLKQVQALRTIDSAIASSFNIHSTLSVLVTQVQERLNVDAATVLVFNAEKQILEFGAARGFHTNALQYTRLPLGQGFAGKAAKEMRTIYIPDLAQTPNALVRAPQLRLENFISYFGVPLTAKGQLKGVMEIFHRQTLDPDDEWREFMETIAGQAAIAIDNADLFNDLEAANAELIRSYDATIEGWSLALELRNQETQGHSHRVTDLTVEIARKLGISEVELIHVRRGALLHDIGKMAIPDSILLKPEKLSSTEMDVMKQHPVFAFRLLSPISFLQPAIDIPYCHHEKWDGSGYPRGLKGKEIPLSARIFSLVDVWDALCSDRPYRKAVAESDVLKYIYEISGSHFDPGIVPVFLELVKQR